jgi:hypothetical protein
MAWYMSVDGEAWEQAPGFRENIVDVLPWYRKKYGSKRFGYVELPTQELLDVIWDVSADLREGYQEVDRWVEWYLENENVPDHAAGNRWPVILSDFYDLALEDGHHRLSDYIRKGAKVIPALYYPKR